MRRLLLFAGLLAIGLAASPARADSERTLRTFLIDVAGGSESDIRALASGKAVSMVVDVDNDREIAIVGAVEVPVPRRFFVRRFSDLTGLHARKGMLQLQKLGPNPSPEDFAALRLPKDDIASLKKSEVGKSDVKLTENALRRLKADVDWSGDAAAGANAIIQDMLFRRTKDYLGGGIDALDPYVDKSEPRPVSKGIKRLLANSRMLFDYVPEFHAYLGEFPAGRLDEASDFLYWSLVDFGMKPTVFLEHAVIYEPVDEHPAKALIGVIGLYASHYFDASLFVMAWVEGALDGGEKASYLLVTRRSWFDGDVKGIKRRKLNGNLKDSMRETLDQQRQAALAAYRASN